MPIRDHNAYTEPLARFVSVGTKDPCHACGMHARGRVRLTERGTGEPVVIALCKLCNTRPDRAVWLRFEPIPD
jgi:hypothetical protein